MDILSQSIDVPTLTINGNDLQYLVCFVYKHEQLLKQYGAIKIQLMADCKLALKKRRKLVSEHSIFKEIRKTNDTNRIYTIGNTANTEKSYKPISKVNNETEFWSSLASSNNELRLLNSSMTPYTSFFYQKKSSVYFDMHRIPKQSFLRVGGEKVTSQYLPYVKRADEPGAIFPLASTRQHLFTVDYHHEGGAHHWYIIPSCQRDALQKVLDEEKLSTCLDHEQIFLDPSILDKNNIRYHRIIQHPNEFVILSAGTLTQSFTEDASLSETIPFALPSWIEDGHANNSITACQCDISRRSLFKTFDPVLFRQDLITKYIHTYLNPIADRKLHVFTGDNYINNSVLPTPQSTDSNALNDDIELSTDAIFCNTRQQSSTNFHTPSTSSSSPSDSDIHYDNQLNLVNDNKNQMECYIDELNHFLKTSSDTITNEELLDFISNDFLSNIDERLEALWQSDSMKTGQNNTSSFIVNNQTFSDEHLMNIVPFNFNPMISTHTQTDMSDETVNISSSSSASSPYSFTDKTEKHVRLERTKNNRKTLFVSGLRHTVNIMDLYKHFIGCIKVILKQARSAPDVKYAFIIHHSNRTAAINLRRPMDMNLFGSNCRVEYADDNATRDNRHQTFDNNKIIVRRIPNNVNETDLHNLFGSCKIVKYCPAINISFASSKNNSKDYKKILLGYAHIHFDNENDAVYVINHVDQYQIEGQQLTIDLFRN